MRGLSDDGVHLLAEPLCLASQAEDDGGKLRVVAGLAGNAFRFASVEAAVDATTTSATSS